MRFNTILFLATLLFFSCDNGGDPAALPGQGGSMARFAIQGNYLYVALNHSLLSFSLNEDGQFSQVDSIPTTAGFETIFAKGYYLYLGASDAMYIYSLVDPAKPQFVFRYEHIVSCDPVVVQGNRAYVTMRSDTRCDQGRNALDIINIADPLNPKLITSYSMDSPGGLAIDGNTLFICDQLLGLQVWDVSNEKDLKLVHVYNDILAYDVIALNGIATVTASDGIFQYTYTEAGADMNLLSTIPVTQ